MINEKFKKRGTTRDCELSHCSQFLEIPFSGSLPFDSPGWGEDLKEISALTYCMNLSLFTGAALSFRFETLAF